MPAFGPARLCMRCSAAASRLVPTQRESYAITQGTKPWLGTRLEAVLRELHRVVVHGCLTSACSPMKFGQDVRPCRLYQAYLCAGKASVWGPELLLPCKEALEEAGPPGRVDAPVAADSWLASRTCKLSNLLSSSCKTTEVPMEPSAYCWASLSSRSLSPALSASLSGSASGCGADAEPAGSEQSWQGADGRALPGSSGALSEPVASAVPVRR